MEGAEATTIDGELNDTCAFLFNYESTFGTIERLTITNFNGSGIIINGNASPTIRECYFSNNSPHNDEGGAINNWYGYGDGVIEYCTFDNNYGVVWGGAICTYNGHITIFNCIFMGNQAGNGSAVFLGNKGIIDNCIFYNNEALFGSPSGSAIIVAGTTMVSNCTFVDNNNSDEGATINVSDMLDIDPYLTFSNNIVAFNTGEGIRNDSTNGTIVFSCNDFWQNSGGSFGGDIDSTTDIDPNTIYEDPLFCDTANNDFTISSWSPCDADSSKCGSLIGMYGVACDYCCNLRGDVDNSGEIDVADLSYLIAFLFQGGPPPPCEEEGNVDGVVGVGGPIDVGDLGYLQSYLFNGGPPPPPCS